MHFLPLIVLAFAMNPAAAPEPHAGCAPGAEVPTFFLRQVTGSRPNLALCLVCRYGRRPVVLMCVREVDAQVEELIERVDRVVDDHRGVGLRGFALWLEPDVRKAQPQMATLARQRKISIPLTFPVESGGPRSMDLPKKAAVTVLMYRNRVVEQRFVFDAGELDEESIAKVVEAVRGLPE